MKPGKRDNKKGTSRRTKKDMKEKKNACSSKAMDLNIDKLSLFPVTAIGRKESPPIRF